jgi:hypothetical protein
VAREHPTESPYTHPRDGLCSHASFAAGDGPYARFGGSASGNARKLSAGIPHSPVGDAPVPKAETVSPRTRTALHTPPPHTLSTSAAGEKGLCTQCGGCTTTNPSQALSCSIPGVSMSGSGFRSESACEYGSGYGSGMDGMPRIGDYYGDESFLQ